MVGELRGRGILIPPRRRVIELTARRIAAVVVAGVVLLASGFMLGQRVGGRQIESGEFIAPETSAISVAATLQQADSIVTCPVTYRISLSLKGSLISC